MQRAWWAWLVIGMLLGGGAVWSEERGYTAELLQRVPVQLSWVGTVLTQALPLPGTFTPTPVPSAPDLDPLADPESAVITALLRQGIPPASSTPSVKAVIQRAPELVYMTVLYDPAVLAYPGRFQESLGTVVKSAVYGGKVFGGWSVERLADLARWARSAEHGDDPTARALAARLRDDNFSAGLAYAGLGGGAILARQLQSGCVEYRNIVRVQQPGKYDNCLEFLVSERLQAYQRR